MPKTLLRSFPDSSSHRATSHLSHLPQFLVSEPALTLFISDRSRLSFSQSNARCPTCGNRRGKMLHLLFSSAFQSVKTFLSHLRSIYLSIGKSSNIQKHHLWTLHNIFSLSPIPVVETLMVCLWHIKNQTNPDWCCYVNVDLVSNFWWPMEYSAIFGSIDIDPSLIRWAQHSQYVLLTESSLARIQREG